MPDVFAAADIGSNTVHMLIASLGKKGLVRLHNESEWLSLGQIVSHEKIIPPTLVDSLAATLGSFSGKARSLGAEGIYVFATEAVRKAENHREILRKLKKQTGLTIKTITPNREAELGLKGALLDSVQTGRFLLVETGGGSVQIALCEGAYIIAEKSLPIGTGVLIDTTNLKSPPTHDSVLQIESIVKGALEALKGFDGAKAIVASGGVARGLWRAVHPDGMRSIHIKEVEHLAWSTQRINYATISSRFSVKAKRAATLLPGALIYKSVMKHFQIEEVQVSQFGVREGAILEISQGKVVPCPI